MSFIIFGYNDENKRKPMIQMSIEIYEERVRGRIINLIKLYVLIAFNERYVYTVAFWFS